MKKLSLFFVITFFFLFGCKNVTPEEHVSYEIYNQRASDPVLLHQATQHLTQVIIQDIFKPPVASRIYAYSFLAAYETMQFQSAEYNSIAGKLNGFKPGPMPEDGKVYSFPLASARAFTIVGERLTFNTDMWKAFEKDFFAQYKAMGIPQDVYDRSVSFGHQMAEHILAYADQDNYKATRGHLHTLGNKPGCWEPTPPTYAEACEPKWNTIRSFTLDSVSQFAPPPPVAYSQEKDSDFEKLMLEVYQLGENMTEEQREIAYFWDDNPFVTNLVGHATYTEKKMTPPGHWVEIVRTVAQDKELSILEALEAYTLSSVAQRDAFIACWDAKYKTDRVRPVTVINNSLDENWQPFLETPAFPEYVSGHSSISAAAGRVLTHLLGENVAFTDSTEYKYGHGVRSFTSFEQAYWETSMSRVYGGIHFRDGVEEGTYQGEKIGDWLWSKLKSPDEVLAGDKVGKKGALKASTN
ncbi:MAG: vanadium-dependent haloperoxidase [Bacteroidetes bacterium]|nr:vanadium-dependent haloperoxidase [Bacteroidota bacterium]